MPSIPLPLAHFLSFHVVPFSPKNHPITVSRSFLPFSPRSLSRSPARSRWVVSPLFDLVPYTRSLVLIHALPYTLSIFICFYTLNRELRTIYTRIRSLNGGNLVQLQSQHTTPDTIADNGFLYIDSQLHVSSSPPLNKEFILISSDVLTFQTFSNILKFLLYEKISALRLVRK